MSKELTSLEWLNYYKKKLQDSGQTIRPNGFDIIETALKDYERLLKMRKTAEWADEKLQTKKKLKSLEIIKEKRVDVCWVIEMINKTLEDYNGTHVYELTQEEYDLLKEVLL